MEITEKTCPLLKKNCIGDKCAVSVIRSGKVDCGLVFRVKMPDKPLVAKARKL